jgi:hypothetical protein
MNSEEEIQNHLSLVLGTNHGMIVDACAFILYKWCQHQPKKQASKQCFPCCLLHAGLGMMLGSLEDKK